MHEFVLLYLTITCVLLYKFSSETLKKLLQIDAIIEQILTYLIKTLALYLI